MFFVIGAPTARVLDHFKQRLEACGDRLRLVVCASLEGYLKNSHKDAVDVYKLPTNFRAHFDVQHPIQQGSHVIHDDQSFKDAQLEVSRALGDLIALAHSHNVPTYFAIVDRKDRPTCITIKHEKVVATNVNQRDLSSLPNADRELTQTVLKELVLPSFQNDEQKLKSELQRLTGGYRKDGTPWTGSFLADVLTVACACCIDDVSAWTRYAFVEGEVLTSGTFSKSATKQKSVPFWCGTFERSAKGNMYSFDTSRLPQMVDALQSFLISQSHHQDIWKSCFVWHDALLNDIDDPPAIRLCEVLTRGGIIEKECNWVSTV